MFRRIFIQKNSNKKNCKKSIFSVQIKSNQTKLNFKKWKRKSMPLWGCRLRCILCERWMHTYTLAISIKNFYFKKPLPPKMTKPHPSPVLPYRGVTHCVLLRVENSSYWQDGHWSLISHRSCDLKFIWIRPCLQLYKSWQDNTTRTSRL